MTAALVSLIHAHPDALMKAVACIIAALYIRLAIKAGKV